MVKLSSLSDPNPKLSLRFGAKSGASDCERRLLVILGKIAVDQTQTTATKPLAAKRCVSNVPYNGMSDHPSIRVLIKVPKRLEIDKVLG